MTIPQIKTVRFELRQIRKKRVKRKILKKTKKKCAKERKKGKWK